MTEVPEINGRPAAKINWHVEEKVGFPNYSNVTVGASLTRYIEDDGTDKTLLKGYKEVERVVDLALEDARDRVGELLAVAQKSQKNA